MDFRFSEAQDTLRKTARAILEKECTGSLIREMEADERGFASDLWTKMAGLGWLGLPFPEQYGGAGGSFLDLTALLEELGRALVPAPFIPTVVGCGLPILAAGSTEQKQAFLPKIAGGTLVLIPAAVEPESTYSASGINLRAARDGGDYVLDGVKLFVPYAQIADYLLCSTRTSGAGERGVSVFLVPAKSPGLSYTALPNIAGDKLAEVAFAKVRVPAANVVGEIDGGWGVLRTNLQQAAVAQCVYMIGGAQRVLEMTTEWAKNRIQYEHPIGSLQAIQHRCADLLTDLTTAKYVTYKAAALLSAGRASATDTSTAKAWVTEAYRRICAHGSHIHGGYGLADEHDMQLYFRRARVAEHLFGDAAFHREIVAQGLGL